MSNGANGSEGLTATIDQDTAAAIRERLNTPEVRAAQRRQLWMVDSGVEACSAELDGAHCLLVEHHADSVEATPHLYDLDELDADIDEDETPTIDEVKAGLQNLSGGVATSQDIENAARAEEGLPPRDQELPLDFGPFNPDAALKAIFDKSVEVDLLRSAWQRKKEDASESKKEYERAGTQLLNLINTFKNRRQQALNPSQPYLREVTDEPTRSLTASKCPWEREHPGQSCPICSAAQAKDIIPAVESEVHPEHEGHKAVAELARVENVLRPLAAQLEKVNLFVEASEMQGLSTEDLNALISYATEPTVIPPQLFARTCLAAEPGSLVQICQTCGISLRSETDNREDGGTWYPEGARVGFDCEGPATKRHIDETPAETAQEPATRKPRSHARRRTDRKSAPETERKAQATEGRKRSISTPERAKKAKAKKGRR